MNYDSHLDDCKKKHKEKKFCTFVNRNNVNNMVNSSSPATRQPTMPVVTYGGFSNKPNFNMKFGKQ